jgi:cyclophilin family peptidyl-prolyl cis-trans isomerase
MSRYGIKGLKFSFIMIFSIILMASKCSKEDSVYRINTKFGDMYVKLYNSTPVHKANFEKLVEEKFYDSLMFHRIIRDFMIQGGDPDSKNAPMGTILGNGGPGYTLDAEIIDTLFHKRGALAAARLGDKQNPERKSSGSQFYIVHGKKFSKKELKQLAMNGTRYKQQQSQQAFMSDSSNLWIPNGYKRCVEAGKKDSVLYFQKMWQSCLDSVKNTTEAVSFTEAQVEAYTTEGGSPHLDGDYTVFGELISGFDILDSIANASTDRRSRPMEDIIFSIEKVKKVQ